MITLAGQARYVRVLALIAVLVSASASERAQAGIVFEHYQTDRPAEIEAAASQLLEELSDRSLVARPVAVRGSSEPLPSPGLRDRTLTAQDLLAAINAGGVVCNVPTFTGPNNIIARNSLAGATTSPTANISGACTYPTSKVQNDIGDLAFVDPEAPAPFIYKLTTGSSAIDQATTVVSVDVDNEGTLRPSGPEKDIGADEL